MTKKKIQEVVASKATIHDYEIIVKPVVTEKSMKLMQEQNKVTLEVKKSANKIDIKNAFERIFQVEVVSVDITNVPSKTTTRGGRYKGTVSGFKKAYITLKEGQAVDLFKE